jgi:hypothetical protein
LIASVRIPRFASGPRYEVDLRGLSRPAAVMLAGGLVLSHLPNGVGLPCPLRALTGVPCPFCGITTSVRSALGGHLGRALSVAPLGLVVLALALALCGDHLRARVRHRPRILNRVLSVPLVPLLVVLGAEWIFELHRFGVLF